MPTSAPLHPVPLAARRRLLRIFPCSLLLLAVVTGQIAAQRHEPPEQAPNEDSQHRRFSELAEECRRLKADRLGETITTWLAPARGAEFRVFRPTAKRPAPWSDASEAESDLFAKFILLRAARAERFFERAKELAASDPPLAYQRLWAALREDPDHAAARRVLGFEQTDQGWHLPYSAKHIKAGRVWHEKFGWIAREDVARYENGQRRVGTSWITAAEDAKRHADIRRGWKIETDHYVVTTNHSLEEGARLAARLERLHHAWRQVFAGYWLKPKDLQNRLNSPSSIPNPPSSILNPQSSTLKHRVTCFRDRDEYIRTLKTAQPRIEMSIGLYLDTARTAYFFAGKEQDAGTVYHEATHQLFKETVKPTVAPADRPNFWIVEAVACYMESLALGDDHDLLGQPDAGRLPAARERLLEDGFYVPLAELIQYDAPQLQRDDRVAKIYSQSAGLATFLVHHDNGRHRPALMKYLQAVYSGKATAKSLEQFTGERLDELDRQYRAFLK